LLAAGCAVVAAVAVAGLSSAGAETLEAVTLRAMIDSPKLKADEARQDGTLQELTAARMAVLPSVSVNFDSTFNGAVKSWPASNPAIPAHPRSVGATIVQPLFDGATYIAVKAGVPIIPVGIGGSERAMPKGAKYIRPSKLYVVVGKPIRASTEAATPKEQRDAARQLTVDLHAELQRLYDIAQARVL